ncbi:hypothetical protein GGQ68_000516 [Sagittula marina]|uniref:Uncharacterized protein n=1 Tax=Sagittula marina TaxID=943940 RepID=A0A7W6DJ53_9RHOB|nr:hypothetical protein [Sagittula marina]MBB3984205.1 hypothetical protein [Sagittula marina]
MAMSPGEDIRPGAGVAAPTLPINSAFTSITIEELTTLPIGAWRPSTASGAMLA